MNRHFFHLIFSALSLFYFHSNLTCQEYDESFGDNGILELESLTFTEDSVFNFVVPFGTMGNGPIIEVAEEFIYLTAIGYKVFQINMQDTTAIQNEGSPIPYLIRAMYNLDGTLSEDYMLNGFSIDAQLDSIEYRPMEVKIADEAIYTSYYPYNLSESPLEIKSFIEKRDFSGNLMESFGNGGTLEVSFECQFNQGAFFFKEDFTRPAFFEFEIMGNSEILVTNKEFVSLNFDCLQYVYDEDGSLISSNNLAVGNYFVTIGNDTDTIKKWVLDTEMINNRIFSLLLVRLQESEGFTYGLIESDQSGNVVDEFGNDGLVSIEDYAELDSDYFYGAKKIFSDTEENIYVLKADTNDTSVTDIVRITPSGELDLSFGLNGLYELPILLESSQLQRSLIPLCQDQLVINPLGPFSDEVASSCGFRIYDLNDSSYSTIDDYYSENTSEMQCDLSSLTQGENGSFYAYKAFISENLEDSTSFFTARTASISKFKSCDSNMTVDDIVIAESGELLIYPNPSNHLSRIILPIGISVEDGSIFTLDGKSVFNFYNTNQVDLSDLHPGLYIVSVLGSNNKVYKSCVLRSN